MKIELLQLLTFFLLSFVLINSTILKGGWTAKSTVGIQWHNYYFVFPALRTAGFIALLATYFFFLIKASWLLFDNTLVNKVFLLTNAAVVCIFVIGNSFRSFALRPNPLRILTLVFFGLSLLTLIGVALKTFVWIH